MILGMKVILFMMMFQIKNIIIIIENIFKFTKKFLLLQWFLHLNFFFY